MKVPAGRELWRAHARGILQSFAFSPTHSDDCTFTPLRSCSGPAQEARAALSPGESWRTGGLSPSLSLAEASRRIQLQSMGEHKLATGGI